MRELSFDDCCTLVRCECPDQYAKSYAGAWLDRVVHARCAGYGIPIEEGMKSQALRVLSNITHWRGETAALVRANLKRLAR